MNGLGLVLGGGAARGAYQAGVLRYLYTDLAPRLGESLWPDIVSGTSVGALNSAFVATFQVEAIEHLSRIWRELTVDRVYRVQAGNVFGVMRSLFGGGAGSSLLDTSPFRQLVDAELPLATTRRVIDSGLLRAWVVSATQISTGFNVLFTDSASDDLDLSPLPGARAQRVTMQQEHVRASAALPFLFPPVSVDGRAYVDGGLRQNTPLRPVLRAGATRALVIALKVGLEEEAMVPTDEGVVTSVPFLAGKALNALLLDPVERDLRQARLINRIVRWGKATYGPDFETGLAEACGVRRVQTLLLRPSEDLGRIAAATFSSRPPESTAAVRYLLSYVADGAESGESDLLSYLYFDREYTSTLEQLGFEDAKRREEELARFLTTYVPDPTVRHSAQVDDR